MMQTIYSKHSQKGFSIVSAIFIVTVLAALASYTLSISAVQHTSNTQTLQKMRARLAAYSGLEWGIRYIQDNNTCPPGGISFIVTAFTVSISQCDASTLITEGTSSYRSFMIESHAATVGKVFGERDYVASTQQVIITGP
ncbi:MAG: hypothetical protein MJA28_15655 [Gammaproteobacteria bacterium]|nr:hypothetical protein [Gammaproteobacteria bacterium]